MTRIELVLDHLTAADAAAQASQELRRQAMRDAHAAGASVVAIATTLGVRNRAGVYQALERPAPSPPPPAPAPFVYIRGSGASAEVWRAITNSMHARGWSVIRDRTQAWHLARGRIPVVMVDISHQKPTVGRVRARYGEGGETELPVAGSRTILDEFDPDEIALAVIEHLRGSGQPAGIEPASSAAADDTADLVAAALRAIERDPTTTRSIALPDTVWDQVKESAGTRQARSLVIAAVIEKVLQLEFKHNAGQPFPRVERLPTGPKPLDHRRASVGRKRQIQLPDEVWSRARGVVAAGHAASLPDLIESALRAKVAAS